MEYGMSYLSTSNTTSFSDRYGRLLPGLLLSGLIAYAAIQLGKLDWMQNHGMSALTLAIMLGIVLGNSVYGRLAPTCGAGVAFPSRLYCDLASFCTASV